jgi:hypothetical protein
VDALDTLARRFLCAEIDKEGFEERCRVPYPGDPWQRTAAIRVGPCRLVQECSRTSRALSHQNAPLAVPFRLVEAPKPWPKAGNDIDHIHDQTLAAVVGMIIGASLAEYSGKQFTLWA